MMDVFISYDSLLHIPMRTSYWSNKQAIYGSVLCIMQSTGGEAICEVDAIFFY